LNFELIAIAGGRPKLLNSSVGSAVCSINPKLEVWMWEQLFQLTFLLWSERLLMEACCTVQYFLVRMLVKSDRLELPHRGRCLQGPAASLLATMSITERTAEQRWSKVDIDDDRHRV
jgi:hypothetical protein